MKCLFLTAAAVAAVSARANIHVWKGAPCDLSSEVVADSGLDNAALEKLLDRAAAETEGRPFVVTRAAWVAALFEHTRVSVAVDDVFADWIPSQSLLGDRRQKRIDAFRERTPVIADTGWPWWKGTHGASVSCLDISHTCPDWRSILKLGPRGLADRARARLAGETDGRARTFLEAVVRVYEAECVLCRRWADAAERRGAAACAAVLRELAEHPPQTLREALQLMLLHNCCQEAEGEWVRSQGLFDRLYLPFYEADLAAGRETRASAKELVRALFRKFYRQAHQNGNNIALGGYDGAGRPVWNALTELVLEVHYEEAKFTPKLTFRYGVRTPEDQLLRVARCLADGRTSVVFMNDEVGREMFLRRGKGAEDVSEAVLVGCYEPAIQGREVIASMSAWINLVKPIELVLNDGCDFAGFRLGPPCALPDDAAAFEAEYLRQLAAMTDAALEKTRIYERAWMELNPAPLFSGTFADCIARGRDAYDGGCRYNQSGVMCAGLATVADSLAAVRHLVDETKAVTMAELRDILRADWKGHEELRLRARNAAPKWGVNDDRADLFGKRVCDFIAAHVNAAANGHGGTFQTGFWSIDHDQTFGALTAATPEGRHAGEPISRNNSATAGCGRAGPTALLLSNAKLDRANAPDGHILDLVLPSSGAQGDPSAAARIAAILRVFASTGGQCVHMNAFNAARLRDAQKHPDRYPDLQVRVCGWNVRWNDLSKREQDYFIATTEAQENP